jgi:hypothetical protein
MRLVVLALSLLTATPAFAGGLGVIVTGGAHTEPLYYYKNTDDSGVPYGSIADYQQKKLTETLPNFGFGLDLGLGDRDDAIIGDCRFYWLMDTPQRAPWDAGSSVPKDQTTVAYREQARNVGIGEIGLTWKLVGNENIRLNAVGHVGSAFLTDDHTEFLIADLGPGVNYRLTRQTQLFGDVSYMLRFRKDFSHSVNAFVGARYMFD